jgi:hypothetical protein
VEFPLNADFDADIFIGTGFDLNTDLQLLFGSEARIVFELQHRFNSQPIHKLVYYHLHHQGLLQLLLDAISSLSAQRLTQGCNKLDPAGNQQDCLGMTPHRILAC